MLGRCLAGTTGIPSRRTLPQGTWAPWMAMIGRTTAPGSGSASGGVVGLKRHRPAGTTPPLPFPACIGASERTRSALLSSDDYGSSVERAA